MNQAGTRDLRIAERFLLAPPVEALFGVEPVSISDLSTTGVRLKHKVPFQSGTKSMLRFKANGIQSEVLLQGEVVWTQKSSGVETEQQYVSGIRTYGERSAVDVAMQRLDDSGRLFRIEEKRSSDRFLISQPVRAEFAPIGAVRITDISGKGARVEALLAVPAGTRGDLRFTMASGALEVTVLAEVAWCRIKAVYSPTENRYHLGLRIVERAEFMRLAIGQLREMGRASKDTHSLKLKFKISRARSKSKLAAAPMADDLELASYFPMIDAVRSELNNNQEEGARWRLIAKLSAAKAETRALAGPITEDQEALSVWEYLERTVDPSIVLIALKR